MRTEDPNGSEWIQMASTCGTCQYQIVNIRNQLSDRPRSTRTNISPLCDQASEITCQRHPRLIICFIEFPQSTTIWRYLKALDSNDSRLWKWGESGFFDEASNQLVGLREKLQETPIEIMGKSMVSCRFSLKSTDWSNENWQSMEHQEKPRWSTSSEGHTPRHQRDDRGLQKTHRYRLWKITIYTPYAPSVWNI